MLNLFVHLVFVDSLRGPHISAAHWVWCRLPRQSANCTFFDKTQHEGYWFQWTGTTHNVHWQLISYRMWPWTGCDWMLISQSWHSML